MSFVNSPKPEYTADGKPTEKKDTMRLFIRIAALFLLITGIGINLYVWISGNIVNELAGTDGVVHGTVYNKENAPLADAFIFITKAPNVMVQTDSLGQFQLNNVPTGAQALIVVHQEIGQEYFIDVQDEGVTQINDLLYEAPPDK